MMEGGELCSVVSSKEKPIDWRPHAHHELHLRDSHFDPRFNAYLRCELYLHQLYRSELLRMAVMLGLRTRRSHAGSWSMVALRASRHRCLARWHDVLFLPRRSLMRMHRHRRVRTGVSSALQPNSASFMYIPAWRQ